MATPPASDEQTDNPDEGLDAAVSAGPFNALTDDLNDLRSTHQHCWLWPQITLEIDRLDDVLKEGHHLLEPLITDRPDWAMKACTGIARSNPTIHQHVERYDSYRPCLDDPDRRSGAERWPGLIQKGGNDV